jgi:hypothetical protein
MVAHQHPQRSLTPEARTNGTQAPEAADVDVSATTPDPQAWKRTVATGWRARAPRHVHSLKWVDHDGIEHLHVLCADDLDDVLTEMATLKLCIQHARSRAEKERAQEVAQTAAADTGLPEPDPTLCTIHDCWMTEHRNDRGTWRSHKLDDGSWCRGQARKPRK